MAPNGLGYLWLLCCACCACCAACGWEGWWCWTVVCLVAPIPLRLSHPPIAAGRGGWLPPPACLSVTQPKPEAFLSSSSTPCPPDCGCPRPSCFTLRLCVRHVCTATLPSYAFAVHGFVVPAALHVLSAAVAAAPEAPATLTHAIANRQPPTTATPACEATPSNQKTDAQQSATITNKHPKWRALLSLSLSPTTAIGRRPRPTPDRRHRPTRARRARRSRPQRRRPGLLRSRRCCTPDGRVF